MVRRTRSLLLIFFTAVAPDAVFTVRTYGTGPGTLGGVFPEIVYSSHRGSREIEHLGSAQDGAGVELLRLRHGSAWSPGSANSTWAWSWARRVARCRSRHRGWPTCLMR
jgi:hypothetical protein